MIALAAVLVLAAFGTGCDALPTRNTVVQVALPGGDPHMDVSGTYTLTITAAEDCDIGDEEGRLPRDARVRQYDATVEQSGVDLDIRVTRATSLYGSFIGRIEPNHVSFNLAWYNDGGGPEPSITEPLNSSRFFAVRGKVKATASENRLAGYLDGQLAAYATENYFGYPLASCSSTLHQFVLSR